MSKDGPNWIMQVGCHFIQKCHQALPSQPFPLQLHRWHPRCAVRFVNCHRCFLAIRQFSVANAARKHQSLSPLRHPQLMRRGSVWTWQMPQKRRRWRPSFQDLRRHVSIETNDPWRRDSGKSAVKFADNDFLALPMSIEFSQR